MECGEFHVSGGWADQERKSLKLIRGSEMRGESCLLIGEYIGPYAYAVDAILRSRELPVTKAMCQVCGSLDAFNVANEGGGEDRTAHASDDEHMEVGSQENVFESLLEQVSDGIVQKELSSKEILLSQEQQEYARNLAKAPICRAVAGSGKTIVGGAAMRAALRIHRQKLPSHRSEFVWITKT